MLEERKLVTVIFVDIVGSTALGGSHDPEVVRATLGRTFSAMSEILQAHGGTVEKFIGDAVMAVFGVPSAHDDDADRAVRAAFAIRDRLADLNRRGSLQLEIRIGIDSGEAVAGTGQDAQNLVTGLVVNSAARLQSGAAPGEILVGTLTRRLTHDGVGYAEPRTIDAKGIGKVEVWAATELLSALPEQHRGLPGLRARLIGRDRELRQLLDVYAGLHGSSVARLVTVFGPPGSGKSRLLEEFVAAVGTGRVRSGRCLPYGEAITYHAIQLIVRADADIQLGDPVQTAIQKLRAAGLAASADRPDADAVARRVAVISGLARAADELPDVAPQELHAELRYGLRRYFECRAATSPLVLVFEDIHWAEPGLLDVITHLAEWSRAPLLLLCSARPEFRELAPTWGSGPANATAIDLQPLSSEDTWELIAELLVVEALPDHLRSDVVSRAEGNPLFVEEFLRMLMETGAIEKRDGRWSAVADLAAVEVPPTLQALITARLDRVSPELKHLLQRGSLAGRLFSTAALAALGDGSPPDPALLREAVRRDLLVQADEPALGSGQVFQFAHVLIRDVAYSTMPKSERSQLHDRYGHWLEQSVADRRTEIAELIAHHAGEAYDYARQLDAPDAQTLGRRTLDLLFAAARNALDRDDVLAASDLFQRAQAIAAVVGATPGELAEAHGYLVIQRRRLATEQRPIGELDEAIALARKAGPSPLLVELLLRRAFQSHQFGSSGTAFVIEGLAVARVIGDAEMVGQAMLFRMIDAHTERGDLAESQRLLDEGLAFVRGTEARRSRGEMLGWGSTLAKYRGDLTQAAVFREESVATLSGSKADRGVVALSTCRFDLDLGDVAAAVAHGRDALALMREVGLPARIAGCCLSLGEALLAAGDPAAALDTLAEGLGISQRRGLRGQMPELAARAARACVRLGDIAGARVHAETARTTVRPSDAEARSIAGVALAEVCEAEGDLAGADAGFRDALGWLEPTGFHNARAFAREAYAEFLLRHGRAADARIELGAAREFHHDPLAFRHRRRIDALLARTQVDV